MSVTHSVTIIKPGFRIYQRKNFSIEILNFQLNFNLQFYMRKQNFRTIFAAKMTTQGILYVMKK